MAEIANSDRLQPSLLERLTDEEPRKTKESRERRAMTIRELRESVLRDVGWLLNTPNFEGLADLESNPEVARSVLNYGVPDIAGRTSSNLDTRHIERAMREAVKTFDHTPRPGFLGFAEPYYIMTGRPSWGSPYKKPDKSKQVLILNFLPMPTAVNRKWPEYGEPSLVHS